MRPAAYGLLACRVVGDRGPSLFVQRAFESLKVVLLMVAASIASEKVATPPGLLPVTDLQELCAVPCVSFGSVALSWGVIPSSAVRKVSCNNIGEEPLTSERLLLLLLLPRG